MNSLIVNLPSFISLLAPAIARSNTVVIVPSEQYPLVALGLYQVYIARSNTVAIVPSEQYPLVALGLYQVYILLHLTP